MHSSAGGKMINIKLCSKSHCSYSCICNRTRPLRVAQQGKEEQDDNVDTGATTCKRCVCVSIYIERETKIYVYILPLASRLLFGPSPIIIAARWPHFSLMGRPLSWALKSCCWFVALIIGKSLLFWVKIRIKQALSLFKSCKFSFYSNLDFATVTMDLFPVF
jgi:hypothetical protein